MQRQTNAFAREQLLNTNQIFNPTYPKELSDQGKAIWAKAVAAYHFVTRTVVYGASNRIDDLTRTGLFATKQIRDAREKNFASLQDVRIRCGAMNALSTRAGNCSEQTHLAILYLLSRRCYSLHLFGMMSGDHAFASIGLNDDSDLSKQINIPNEAIIIDTWARDIYLATEYPSKVANARSMALKKGLPYIRWSYEKDGLTWLPGSPDISNEQVSALLQQFLIDHASIPESELRSQKLISGDKPQKLNQAGLMAEIRGYQKPTLFKYKKNVSQNGPRAYSNERGFEHVIEKLADNMLALHFINEVEIKNITLDAVMPFSRIPDFSISSLHKEKLYQADFDRKFTSIFNHYYSLCEYRHPYSYCIAFEKLKELVTELEEHIQMEFSTRIQFKP